MVNSEFDELKYRIKNSKIPSEKYANLKIAYDELIANKRQLELKLRDKNEEEERLIIVLAKLNLKLMDYEKEKLNNILPNNVEEE